MTTLRPALLGLVLLTACDSLPGALDEEEGGGSGGPPPAAKAYLRIENHGPTLVVDSLIGVKCLGAPAPRDTVRQHFTLTAPDSRTLQIPASVCYDYVTYVTAPAIAYVGPYDWSTLSPPAGDTVVMHLYDPI
jgi:hypothetical protein